jgi:hypothetical protein
MTNVPAFMKAEDAARIRSSSYLLVFYAAAGDAEKQGAGYWSRLWQADI